MAPVRLMRKAGFSDPEAKEKRPRLKRYLNEMAGIPHGHYLDRHLTD